MTVVGFPLLSDVTGAQGLNQFNVRDFGAAGTGTVNDQAAIAATVTAAGPGGTVYFPPGTYLISTTGLTMLTGQWWVGYGATIQAGPALNLPLVSGATSGTNGGIFGLTLDGSKATQTGGAQTHTFVGSLMSGFSLVDVLSINAYLNGLFCFTCTDTLILACRVTGAGNIGIYTQLSTRTRIVACEVQSSGNIGIANGNGSFLTVSGCVVDLPGFIGISGGSAGRGMVVTGCTVSNGSDHAIDTGAVIDVSVTGNTTYNCTAGYSADFSSLLAATDVAVVFTGNAIDTMSQQGINIANGSGFVMTGMNISNNTIVASQQQGITIGPQFTQVMIANNVLHNNGISGLGQAGLQLFGACTYCTVIGNTIHANPNFGSVLAYGSVGQANNTFIDNDLLTPSGTTFANVFSGTPAATDIIRNNRGLNPIGVVVVAVPGTGVAVAATYYDRTFYITDGALGCTIVISNGPTIVIPASSFSTVRLPAGQTLTPTFTNAPTWVVEGE